jgi:hypothetical protein
MKHLENGEDYIMCNVARKYWGDQMKSHEMRGICQGQEKREVCTDLWPDNVKEKEHLGDTRVDERRIFKADLKKKYEDMWSG